MGYDKTTGEYAYYEHDKLPVSYHGTGDIFSSTCVGAMMNGMDWKEAVKVAADYTAECIRLTLEDPAKPWYFKLSLFSQHVSPAPYQTHSLL